MEGGWSLVHLENCNPNTQCFFFNVNIKEAAIVAAMMGATSCSGVAGLSSLFIRVLEAADELSNRQPASVQSHALKAQFEGHIALFERWGRVFGFAGNQLPQDDLIAQDPRTASKARQLLQLALDTLTPGGVSGQYKQWAEIFLESSLDITHPQTLYKLKPPRQSRGGGRALHGNPVFSEQVLLFGKVVDRLSKLVSHDELKEHQRLTLRQSTRPNAAQMRHSQPIESQDLQRKVANMTKDMRAGVRREVGAWLLGHFIMSNCYHESLRRKLDGTCEWILARPEFIQWLSSPITRCPLLWVHGHAGFGKTILCARAIEYLLSVSNGPVAYFFFSSDLFGGDDASLALRSWVSQLSMRHSAAFELARQKWEFMADDATAPLPTILQLLHDILNILPNCSLVIDGLDQCSGLSGSIENMLRDLSRAVNKGSRVLIVSRDEAELRRALFERWEDQLTELRISAQDVREDASAISKHMVDKKLPNKSEDVKQRLSNNIRDRCDGQLLWLAMHEASLRKGMSFKDLLRVTSRSPAGVHRVYDRYWDVILSLPERDRVRAYAIFRWVAFSTRPLHVREIAEAVLLGGSDSDFPVDDLPDAIDDDYIESEIMGVCGPLLEISNDIIAGTDDEPTLRLAHFTVREYLLTHLPVPDETLNNKSRLSAEQKHELLLARFCICYIRHESAWRDVERGAEPRFRRYFRRYASQSWHVHLRSGGQSDTDEYTLDTVEDFMTGPKYQTAWNKWVRWFKKEQRDKIAKEESAQAAADPLYFATRLGLTQLVRRMLYINGDLRQQLDKRGLALHAACRQGDAELARALLDAHADIEAPGYQGRPPLFLAIRSEHLEIVNLLLERGASAFATVDNGLTTLIMAASKGHLGIFRAILETGVDMLATDNNGWNALLAAATSGSVEVVEILLDKGVSHSAAARDGFNALLAAAGKGHTGVAHLLLDRGADLSAVDEDGWTALLIAANCGRLEMARLLLEAGADCSNPNSRGWAALCLAADKGFTDIVRLLVEHGADISTKDPYGHSPLRVAAGKGYADLVATLIELGADTSSADYDGTTPVLAAIQNGNLDVCNHLLSNNANFTTPDSAGVNPLLIAAKKGLVDIVRALLEKGADINAQIQGATSLLSAAARGHIEVVKTLLEYGADTTITNSASWDAVSVAAYHGFSEVVRSLLHSGARMCRHGTVASCSLVLAATRGHVEVVQVFLDTGVDAAHLVQALIAATNHGRLNIASLLLGNGADVLGTDKDGRSPIFIAARKGHVELVKLLLDFGANAMTFDSKGRSPLLDAANRETAQVLLEYRPQLAKR